MVAAVELGQAAGVVELGQAAGVAEQLRQTAAAKLAEAARDKSDAQFR